MTTDPPVSLWPDPDALGPVTDLYQLTMMAGYLATGRQAERATFELFARRLPENRAYLVLAGLEQAIADLLRLRFSREQVDALRSWATFSAIGPGFFDWLLSLRFMGDVWAVPEGTVVFAGEPFLRVEAALPEAQWVETFLLASLGYPTLVASKAARVVDAAGGRPVFDFGARRGQGPQSGFIAARSSYLAGCAGTSHVEAARRLGIPCVGTMAHSWVQSFPTESASFASFARLFPQNSTLLVDTYGVESGVRTAGAIAPPVQGVRLDSGDLKEQARQARAILDSMHRGSVKIVASGDLDEHAIGELVAEGAPIDAFGVGTELITSRDAPALALVYKLVEIEGRGTIKLSPGKKTYPFAKQVYRSASIDGTIAGDRIVKADETSAGEPLLVPVVRGGSLVRAFPGLDTIRERCRNQVAALPDSLRGLGEGRPYPVSYSPLLEAEADRLAAEATSQRGAQT